MTRHAIVPSLRKVQNDLHLIFNMSFLNGNSEKTKKNEKCHEKCKKYAAFLYFPIAFRENVWYIADMKQDIDFRGKTTTTYGRGYAYLLRYHLVWCTQACREWITNELMEELSVFLSKTASDLGMKILQEEIRPDYIHLYVDCKPQTRLSDDIKILKGNTARWLYLRHPGLKQESGVWDTHYLAVIDNGDFQEQIDEYLTTRRSKGGRQPMS